MSDRKDNPERSGGMREALLRFLSPIGKPYYAGDRADDNDQLRMDILDGVKAEDLVAEVEAARVRPTELYRGGTPVYGASGGATPVGGAPGGRAIPIEFARTPDPLAGKVILKTAYDVLQEWFETSVARYDRASVTADELYDGLGGITLKSFAKNHAPGGVRVTQRQMEAFLASKGIPHRSTMFKRRYEGIRHIIYGNVRSGNYGT